jgi:hypothetical protein
MLDFTFGGIYRRDSIKLKFSSVMLDGLWSSHHKN